MMLYPWQSADWTRLQAMRAKLPHAILLSGQAGTGKRDFAMHFAQGLLCDTPAADGQPCQTCAACNWFAQGNHPDFHLVRPEAMEEASDTEKDAEGKKKAPSKIIRMEQVRQLIEAIGVGTHRAGLRVVVLYPLDALQTEGANALLKTLEEPPQDTVFLLVTDRIDRILPTILSRCRQFPLQPPQPEAARQWLERQGVPHASSLLAEFGNAPLAALQAAESEERPLLQFLLEQLAQGPKLDALATADHLQKLSVPAVLSTMHRWIFDLMAARLADRPRYFPAQRDALQRCAGAIPLERLERFARALPERRRTEQHPLAARVVIESLLLDYRQLFPAA